MAKNHFARAEIDSQCVLKKGIFVEKWTQNFDLGTGNAIFGSPKVAKNCQNDLLLAFWGYQCLGL